MESLHFFFLLKNIKKRLILIQYRAYIKALKAQLEQHVQNVDEEKYMAREMVLIYHPTLITRIQICSQPGTQHA